MNGWTKMRKKKRKTQRRGANTGKELPAGAGKGLALLPRLEFSGMIIAHCSLELLVSSDLPASASQVTGTTSMAHHSWLFNAF
ncbi:Protein PPP5D1 [Plecturocebus cupreus]